MFLRLLLLVLIFNTSNQHPLYRKCRDLTDEMSCTTKNVRHETCVYCYDHCIGINSCFNYTKLDIIAKVSKICHSYSIRKLQSCSIEHNYNILPITILLFAFVYTLYLMCIR